MIDARNIYRKVTRKIYDFSPEQLKNLTSIVWLYRREKGRFLELVQEYLDKSLLEANGCFLLEEPKPVEPLPAFVSEMEKLLSSLPAAQANKPEQAELLEELHREVQGFRDTMGLFEIRKDNAWRSWNKYEHSDIASLKDFADTRLAPLAETSRDLIKDADLLYKLASRIIEACEQDDEIKESEQWKPRDIARARKDADSARKIAVEQLRQVRYFYKQAHWLQERFPDAELRDVLGLVKLVDREELEKNDWSLTPGRYVGVAPEEVDEDFDFEEALREIHVELSDLNTEATELAATIARNFEELGV